MRILIDENWHKVNNFIDYIIENFADKGKQYKLKLKVEDVYDKRLINKRVHSLQNKLLLQLEDGFEICEADFESVSEGFPELITKYGISAENFKEQIIMFELEFVEELESLSLSFKYLK